MKPFKALDRCHMKTNLALLGLFGTCLAFGSDYGKDYVQISKTQSLEFPAAHQTLPQPR